MMNTIPPGAGMAPSQFNSPPLSSSLFCLDRTSDPSIYPPTHPSHFKYSSRELNKLNTIEHCNCSMSFQLLLMFLLFSDCSFEPDFCINIKLIISSLINIPPLPSSKTATILATADGVCSNPARLISKDLYSQPPRSSSIFLPPSEICRLLVST